jgi:hypothetical protein
MLASDAFLEAYMQRRTFLQLPVMAAPVVLPVSAGQEGRSGEAVKVDAGQDRFGVPSFKVEAAQIDCPHTFAKISDGPARMLLVYQPAGTMEQYFRDVTRFAGPPTEEENRRLFEAHDMKVVGPPLPTD